MTQTHHGAEAFVLLTLDHCTLQDTSNTTHSGTLYLECVTVPSYPYQSQSLAVPSSHSGQDQSRRDVYLVLRIGAYEGAVDPVLPVQIREDKIRSSKVYNFPTGPEPSNPAIVLRVRTVQGDKASSGILEDIETFEGILDQYAQPESPIDVEPAMPGSFHGPPQPSYSTAPPISKEIPQSASFSDPSLRGHLVLINQDNGEVVGQVEDPRLHIQEEDLLKRKGLQHADEPVVIEVPDDFTAQTATGQPTTALDVFVRTVTKEDRDLITKGATVISHAISHTTTLLLTLVSAGTDFYKSRSKPNSRASSPVPGGSRGPESAGGSAPGGPSPSDSKVLMFLTSARTRSNMAKVHTLTGQAVTVSAKTISVIDGMVKRAVGRKDAASRPSGSAKWNSPHSKLVHKLSATGSPAGSTDDLKSVGGGGGTAPPLPPRSKSPTPSAVWGPGASSAAPPAYAPSAGPNPSFAPSHLPGQGPGPGYHSPSPQGPPQLPPRRPLSKTAKIILSADLILSTMEESAKRIVGGGEQGINGVISHKYGSDAGETSALMTGSARNVALVYIDMAGIGRRALIKKVGKEFVRARVMKGRDKEMMEEQDRLMQHNSQARR